MVHGGPKQSLRERCTVGRPGAIVHFEVLANDGEPLGHAQDRRYADAPGQQQVATRVMGERKVVLREADLQQLTLKDLLVHRPGAASGLWIAQHGDHITVAIRRVIAQGVGTREPAWQMPIHV